MNANHGNMQKIARTEEPVFFMHRNFVTEYWPHLQLDPDMPKRDSPDEWIAAVDRGEIFVLGARVIFLDQVGV